MEWLPLWTILVLSLLGTPTPSQAAESSSDPYVLAIVLGGGRKESDAKKAINEFRAADSAKVMPADGYPKIVSSDDVKGAPPDTYLAVLGYCEASRSNSVLVARMVMAISTGAYSMPMVGKFENACPALAPELVKDEDSNQPKKKRR